MKLLKQFLKEGGVINGVELIDNKLYYVRDKLFEKEVGNE